jgi:hypothetical protein
MSRAREAQTNAANDLSGLAQVIHADRDDLCVQSLYLVISVLKLTELDATERSPECPVEDQHDVVLN